MSNICDVKIESTVPAQQYMWAKKIAVQTHCFFQIFIKFAQLGIFHSYAELLHAAGLESNPDVSTFTPQPINIFVNGERYVPDCFHLEKGKQIVTEIKHSAEARIKNRAAIENKLNESNIDFRVIENADILKKERELLNWLQIVRCLSLNNHLSTDEQENLILEFKSCNREFMILDFLGREDNKINFLLQLGFMRLLYKHKLFLKEPEKRLSLGSWVK